MDQQNRQRKQETEKSNNDLPSDDGSTYSLKVTESVDLSPNGSDSDDLHDVKGNRMIMHLINTDKSLSEADRQEYAEIMGLSKSKTTESLIGDNIKTVRIRNRIIYHVLDKNQIFDKSKAVSVALKIKSDADKAFDEQTTKSSKTLQLQAAATALDKSTTTITPACDDVTSLRMTMTVPDTTTDATNSDAHANVARTKQHPSQKKRRHEGNDDDVGAQEDLNRLADFAQKRKNKRACQLIEELRMVLFE